MSLTPQVKDLTEAIQSLPSLLEAIFSLAANPGGIIILCLFFVWILVNRDFSRVFGAQERKERRQLEQINEYISSPDSSDPEMLKALKDLRDARYFKVATGIYAESQNRSVLIKAHQITSRQITWRQIRRAQTYIDVAADGVITVRNLSLFEKFGFWYNEFITYGCFLLSALLIGLASISNQWHQTSLALGLGLSLLIAIFTTFQNVPIYAQRKMAKELKLMHAKNPTV